MSRVTERNKPDDEDASQLKFPQAFSDDDTQQHMLSISDVKVLLEAAENTAQEEGRPIPDNPVYNKTKDYVNTFARFLTKEIGQQARDEVPFPEFQYYEQVQLVNLCPMEAEEAKALVPSIKMDDETLQGHLDSLTLTRKNQQV
ncbi:RNA polymerase B [Rhodotorula kratochvilovae]